MKERKSMSADEWGDWIEHDGGECPVPGNEEVIVRLISGIENSPRSAELYRWMNKITLRDNITHYKRRKSAVAAESASTPAAHPDASQAAEKQSALSGQVGGDHYKKLGAYQPWEVLRRWITPEEFRGYMKGTAIAYLARERDKGGDEDIAKAAHTLQALLEMARRDA